MLSQINRSSKDILKKNPFSGLVFCEMCGKKLVYNKHTSGSGITEERLHCPGKEYAKGSIKIDELKEVIKNEISNLRDAILSNKSLFLDEVRLKASNLKTNSLTSLEEDRYKKLLKRSEELDFYMKNLTEQLTDEIISESIYKTMMQEYTEEKEIVESSINRFKLIEEKNEEKLDHQAHIIVDTLENMNEDDFDSQLFLRSLISKILITSIPEPHTMKKRKEITIIYKKCNDYINNFMNEISNKRM